MVDECLTRRTFLRGLGACATASLLGCAETRIVRGSDKRRPNVLVILPDDLGWSDVGYHDSPIRTPHIDRLARQGLRLEQHYVMPTCTPTRVGLMTGRYPSRFGVTAPAYGKIFEDDTLTLPAMLRRMAYHTAISGKWHMGSPPEETPRKYGFDESYGYFHGQIDPYTHHYKTGAASWHRNDELLDEQGHATDLITAEAIRVIETPRDKPFFLYVAYSVPHFPLSEPQHWLDLYPDTEPISRRWYAAAVSHMDDGIGRILDALDRTGQRDQTLMLLISDNGGQKSWHSASQYHGRYADKPHTVLGDNRPWRGWKGDVYEGGIRVPAVVHWPGHIAGGRCDTPIHVVDWMPTFAEMTGFEPGIDPQWDGRSVWNACCGHSGAGSERTMYWKTPNARALRQGDWKLILSGNAQKPQLYHLKKDPYEQADLAADEPARVTAMRNTLEHIGSKDRE